MLIVESLYHIFELMLLFEVHIFQCGSLFC